MSDKNCNTDIMQTYVLNGDRPGNNNFSNSECWVCQYKANGNVVCDNDGKYYELLNKKKDNKNVENYNNNGNNNRKRYIYKGSKKIELKN